MLNTNGNTLVRPLLRYVRDRYVFALLGLAMYTALLFLAVTRVVWADEAATPDVPGPIVNPADPVAAIIGALGVIAGALKLPERWGLSAAQVAMLMSALITIAATARTLVGHG